MSSHSRLSPGVVDFAPEGPARDFWRSYAWLSLLFLAISLLVAFFW